MNKKLDLHDEIKVRKNEHLYVVAENNVETNISAWLEHVILIHKALPEIDFDSIDLSCKLLGRVFSAPILIEGMTGGTKKAATINENLAYLAEKYNLPMGVGSQRVALEHNDVAWTFKIARETAPTAFLVGNIGAPQLRALKISDIEKIVSMIEANALAIHLNPLQEVVQPAGDTDYKGILEKIEKLVETLDVPIIVKETGAGISRETAQQLINIGVKAIDVAGVGGTSWSAVEYYRAKKRGDTSKTRLGKLFWDWGIPTAASIIEVKSVAKNKADVIGSGGIRTGLDAAKAISIGADFVGMARPFLIPAMKGVNELENTLNLFLNELKTTMFLTGSKTINDLKKTPKIILPPLRDWIDQRKLTLE